MSSNKSHKSKIKIRSENKSSEKPKSRLISPISSSNRDECVSIAINTDTMKDFHHMNNKNNNNGNNKGISNQVLLKQLPKIYRPEIKPKKLIAGMYNESYLAYKYNQTHYHYKLIPFQEKLNKQLGNSFINYGGFQNKKKFINKTPPVIFQTSSSYDFYFNYRIYDKPKYFMCQRPKLRRLEDTGSKRLEELGRRLFNLHQNEIKRNLRNDTFC